MDGCPRCGTKSHPDDLFCGQCGFNLLAHQQNLGATLKELKVGDVQLSLGIIYFKKKEYEKARETFQRILRKDAKNMHARRLLNQAQKSLMCQTEEVGFA